MLTTFLAFLISLQASPNSRQTIEFTKDSLGTVRKNIDAKKAVLIDVRSLEEWNKGHLEDSVFVPVTSLRKKDLDAKKLAKIVPPKKIVYTFCVVGMRAKQAGAILEKLGYQVRVLKPGYEDLVKAGFKKAKNTPNENTRQRNAG
jgi:rhodanese-related sulfurtransferase